MNGQTRYSPEVRTRAVRMVFEHRGEHASEWAAISSIASKIGCKAETLRRWVRRSAAWRQHSDRGARADQGARARGSRAAASQRDPKKGERLFCPGGARPPAQAMIGSSTPTALSMGSSRSAEYCRSPRRHIANMRRGVPIRRSCRPEPSGMPSWLVTSAECGTITSRSMGCGRYGASCGARASRSPAALSPD